MDIKVVKPQAMLEGAGPSRAERRAALSLERRRHKPSPQFIRKKRPRPYRGHKRHRRG